MNDDRLVRQVRRGLQATLVGLAFSYGGTILLAPWKEPDVVNARVLLVLGITIGSFSLSLGALGIVAEGVEMSRPWIKPVSAVSFALGLGIVALAAVYLLV